MLWLVFSLATAVVSLNTARYEVRLALSQPSDGILGGIGGLAGANLLCNEDQTDPWYPIINTENGMNPDVLSQIAGKEDDILVVRTASGRLLDKIYISPANLTDFFSYGITAWMALDGSYKDGDVWVGNEIYNCSNWSTNTTDEGRVYSLIDGNPLLADCDQRRSVLCMSNIIENVGIDPEPFVRELAMTVGTYDGNLGGFAGANLICETEAGEPGWTAVLFNRTGTISDNSFYPNGWQTTRWDWRGGGSFLRNVAARNLEASFETQIQYNEQFSSLPAPIAYYFDGSPVAKLDVFFYGLSGVDCVEWTDENDGITVGFLYQQSFITYPTPTDCIVPSSFTCVSPPVPNTIEPPAYQIASSAFFPREIWED